MKLSSTVTVPLKINISDEKHAIRKDGYLNITFKAGMKNRQKVKAFFYISMRAFLLGIKQIFKRRDSE